jgi:LAS superfamily LD-carboxypeptidase LdcB
VPAPTAPVIPAVSVPKAKPPATPNPNRLPGQPRPTEQAPTTAPEPVPAPTAPVIPAVSVPRAKPPEPTLAEKLISFSSGSGDQPHFDRLKPDVRTAFIKMIGEYGKPVTISSAFRTGPEQQSLWDQGTPVFGNENIRMKNGYPVLKPGTSSHETGKAIDLTESIVTALKTTTSSTGNTLLKTYGFNTQSDDPIHLEKARFGGSFDGPESGYPVMLHGPEVAIPEPNFRELKETAESVSKSSLSSVMPSPVSATNKNNDSTVILKNLHNLMTDKFDQMITIMERTNDIQYRILNNSMV